MVPALGALLTLGPTQSLIIIQEKKKSLVFKNPKYSPFWAIDAAWANTTTSSFGSHFLTNLGFTMMF